MPDAGVMDLRARIEQSINGVSAENESNTPDFILAEYLVACLAAFDAAVNRREQWYGRGSHTSTPESDETGAADPAPAELIDRARPEPRQENRGIRAGLGSVEGGE